MDRSYLWTRNNDGEQMDEKLTEPVIPQAIQDLQILLSKHIEEIKACFKDDVKIAIVIRNTTRNGANIVIGDATTEDINLVVNYADEMLDVPGNTKGSGIIV